MKKNYHYQYRSKLHGYYISREEAEAKPELAKRVRVANYVREKKVIPVKEVVEEKPKSFLKKLLGFLT